MDDEGSGPDHDDGPSRDHHHHDGTLKGSGRDHDGPMEIDLDPKHPAPAVQWSWCGKVKTIFGKFLLIIIGDCIKSYHKSDRSDLPWTW